jgi:hypothetical protein
MAAGATENTVAASLPPNGQNNVDLGDAIVLTSDGGAANAASVPGYYSIVVRETSQ